MTRGKCRYDSAAVTLAVWGWQAEDGRARPYECDLAPPVSCPPCDGTGSVIPPADPRPVRCLACEGRGEVPGPHWPWRHPNPMEER